jgi:hypothetical protein
MGIDSSIWRRPEGGRTVDEEKALNKFTLEVINRQLLDHEKFNNYSEYIQWIKRYLAKNDPKVDDILKD